MNFDNLELSKHRRQQFEREAKNNRLVREAHSGDQPANPVLNSVLAALGEQLIELGSRLQERNEQNAHVPKFEAR
jgi:hypothetical protein